MDAYVPGAYGDRNICCMEISKVRLSTKELTICSMFTSLIIIGAFIKIDIPLPLYTMHFTLQWFFVIMAGLLLGEKLGTISVIVYIGLGLAGIPIFAAGGGIGYILRPGFGFLLGFVLAAFIIGILSKYTKNHGIIETIMIATVGMVLYYTVGAVYFYLIKNFYTGDQISFRMVVVSYCLITVIPDFILCVMASFLCRRIKPTLVKALEGSI